MRSWKDAKLEPGEAFQAERPSLFDQSVYRALAEDLISESKAAELLGQSLNTFHTYRKMESPNAVADR